MPIDKNIFVLGMDKDSDDRLISNQKYRDARNVRVGSSGQDGVGALENVNGNVLIDYTEYLENDISGTVIGSYRSEDRDSIFAFVYSPTGDHSIYEYNHQTNDIVLVLQNQILNFNPNYLITGINDIGGLLYWTDDYNPPRKINIEKAIKHTASGGMNSDGYSETLINGSLLDREKFITAIKAQPTQRPTFEYVTDDNKDYNYVRGGKYFRFKYRYVYDDNEKSAWSAISELAYTDYDVLESYEDYFEQLLLYNTNLYNGIRISFLPGHETVSRIEVAASKNNSDFFKIADVDRRDGDVQSIIFFNDEVYTAIDVNDSIKPYDDLPRLAKSQELIEGNKIAYGNYVTGYNHHNVRTSLSPSYFEAQFTGDYLEENSSGFGGVVSVTSAPWDEYLNLEDETGIPESAIRKGKVWPSHLQLRDDILNAGYELSSGSYVQVEYSLGFTEEPSSLSIASGALNEYSSYEGPNTTNIPTTNFSITIFIPENAQDPVLYFAEQLYNYTLIGDEPSITLASKAGIWRRYNPSGYLAYMTIDQACEAFDDSDISGLKFGEFFTFESRDSNPYRYYSIAPGESRSGGLFPFFTSNDDNGAIAGVIGVSSFHLRSYQINPDGLSQTFNFPQSDKMSTFKAGAHHTFGLVYHDEYGRYGFVNSPRKVYVPHLNERPLMQSGYSQFGTNINWNVFGYAPSWAKYYSWFYSGNSKGYDFLQFKITNIEDTAVSQYADDIIRISLKLLSEYQSKRDNISLSYDFARGDRMRLIANQDGFYFEENVDLPIISAQDGVDGEYILTIPRVSQLETTDLVYGCLVEIYSDKPDASVEEQIFYEISPKYPVTQVSLLDGTVVGQHTVESGTFNKGDVYITKRTVYGDDPTSFMAETPSISDFHDSSFKELGRPNSYDKDQGEERYISQVTYSMPYISGSKINGLSNFNPVIQPYKEYDRAFGGIQKLFSQDAALIIFQEDKVTRSAVSRNIIFDNQGNSSVIGTVANTLSDGIPYKGDFGISKHPESFAEYGGRIYFADAKRGVVLRLSGDGITDISRYGMTDYFMDELTSNSGSKIYGGFDPRYSEYLLTIGNSDTVAFSEPMNAWTSFYSYKPETMVYLYRYLYSFKGGKMYKHDASLFKNAFYNVHYNSEITFVSNANPSNKKVYKAISLEGDAPWELSSAITPSGQLTFLSSEDFQEREGFYYSDLMFDVNTPNVDNPIIEGDRMRDYALIVTLVNGSYYPVELFAVNMNTSISSRHNV